MIEEAMILGGQDGLQQAEGTSRSRTGR